MMAIKMAKDLHVVLVPYLAFGHLFPFFHLSLALAKAGIHVSFISTPKNIQKLPKPPSELSSFINFVAFPLPVIHGSSLPEGADNTFDFPLEKEKDLKAAYDLLCHPFKQFIINEAPDWIGVDLFPHWVIDIAREFCIPVFLFCILSAATRVFSGSPEYMTGDGLKKVRPSPESLTSPPKWVTFPSTAMALRRGSEANWYYHHFFYGDMSERIAKILNGCRALVIRSCKEIEGDYLELLEKILQKPIIPWLLLPIDQPNRRDYDEEWLKRFNWLDQQKPKSVVFVGFGSSCKLSKDQVHEIAHGLELSDLPFIWSLVKPEIPDDVEVLPQSFIKNTAKRGLVCMGWAPQAEILANTAIGGSLFHGGWGSVLENLKYGHRLMVLPLLFDHGIVARLLVEKGLAVQVEQDEDRSFTRDAIAECLRRAMDSEEGTQIGIKVAEVAAAVNHQEHQVGELVQYLKNWVATQT